MPKWRFDLRTGWLVLGLVLSILCIHYGVARNSIWLLPCYSVAFVCYLIVCLKVEFSFLQLLVVAIAIRLGLFWGVPSLSDDYFRFVWDGQIRTEDFNPYTSSPAELVDQLPERFNSLYSCLNSSKYHSTYPPLSQYIFSIPAWSGINDVFWFMTVMRSILLLFDIGVLILLFQFTARVSSVLVYAFNPLVILELTGNLHFEGVVIFFLLLAWWLYKKGNGLSAALALSFGILTKLTPLMFLPVLFRKLGFQKAVLNYLVIVAGIVLFSIPFLDFHILGGMGDGLDLFFRKFEFNAGLFFLIREIGFWFKGYDTVQTVGPWLSIIAFGLIVVYSILIVEKSTNWAKAFTVILFVQLIFATTVHPWYIIPLVAFGCVTGYAFPVVWSGLIFLSYLGYSTDGYQHPVLWIAIEYLVVLGVGSYELIKGKTLFKYV